MNFKQVEYFVRVAELGSFTRASLVLGVSQPSLSRQIRLLELELRQSLLYRNGRGVALTAAGRCFLEHGQEILHAITRARGALTDLRSDPRGRIVVGLPTRIAQVLTTPLVKAFRTKLPHATISIAEGSSSVLHEWLVLSRIDVALLIDPPHGSELELHSLHKEELVLVGPRKQQREREEISLAEIEQYPLILPRLPNPTRRILEKVAAKAHAHLRISMEVDTSRNILELVAGRLGYAVLPRGAVSNAGGETRFQIIAIRPPVTQHIFIAISKRGPANRLAAKVAALLHELNVPTIVDQDTPAHPLAT